MAMLMREVEDLSGKDKFDRDPSTYAYPRRGPNNRVREVDLRI
jgi:hypothetical protein